MTTSHQMLTDFVIEGRQVTRGSLEEQAVHEYKGCKYIRENEPEINAVSERVYTVMGLIWTATHHGGFIQGALEEARLKEETVQQYIDCCREKTYSQRRTLGRTIVRAHGISYMDVSWGNIFDFTGEEMAMHNSITLFRVLSRGGRVP